jgi:hypothetical protein
MRRDVAGQCHCNQLIRKTLDEFGQRGVLITNAAVQRICWKFAIFRRKNRIARSRQMSIRGSTCAKLLLRR